MILEKLKNEYGNKSIFLASSDTTGCSTLRIVYPYMFLKDTFTTIDFSEGFPRNNPKTIESDVVWLQRAVHEYFIPFIEKRRLEGKFTIMDLDDWMWDIGINPAAKFYPKKELNKLDNVIKCCDCLTTSTIPMKENLEKRFPDKKVFLLQNHLWKHERFIIGDKPKNDKIKIMFAGSWTHVNDFDKHLVNVLRNLPKDKCDFYCMGYTPTFMKDFAISVPWVETSKFHQAFKEHNPDISIMVAHDNMFNKCKSSLKYLEGSSVLSASVGHSVYPYKTIIEHGVDGFLVENPKIDWKSCIYRLIEDDEFRLNMAQKAQDKVSKYYTYDDDSDNLEQTYLDIFNYLYKGTN